MIQTQILLAIAALSIASCAQKPAAPVPVEGHISTIPVSIGNSRKDVIASMGMPNAALSSGETGEILDLEPLPLDFVAGEVRKDGFREDPNFKAKFQANPEVLSSNVWRYYGYGDNKKFATIYFKDDSVIGITHGMTQAMIGGGYAK